MAYTLKTSGIATNLKFCLAVTQDGTAVQEFANSSFESNKVVAQTRGYGTGANQVQLGSGTWKGVTLGTFETKWVSSTERGGIDFASGFRPILSGAGTAEAGIFVALDAMTNYTGSRGCVIPFTNGNFGVKNTGKLQWHISSVDRGPASNTTIDLSTKLSFGSNLKLNGSGTGNIEHFYGLESGSLASDVTPANSGYSGGGDMEIRGVCTDQSDSTRNIGRYFLIALFDRQLTLAEYQSLHNDWANTLFDGVGGGGGGGITLAQVERGRAMGRGFGRGMF